MSCLLLGLCLRPFSFNNNLVINHLGLTQQSVIFVFNPKLTQIKKNILHLLPSDSGFGID